MSSIRRRMSVSLVHLLWGLEPIGRLRRHLRSGAWGRRGRYILRAADGPVPVDLERAARSHRAPVEGEDVVGSPAEQERAGLIAGLLDPRRGLAVEVPHGPPVALEPGPAVHRRKPA